MGNHHIYIQILLLILFFTNVHASEYHESVQNKKNEYSILAGNLEFSYWAHLSKSNTYVEKISNQNIDIIKSRTKNKNNLKIIVRGSIGESIFLFVEEKSKWSLKNVVYAGYKNYYLSRTNCESKVNIKQLIEFSEQSINKIDLSRYIKALFNVDECKSALGEEKFNLIANDLAKIHLLDDLNLDTYTSQPVYRCLTGRNENVQSNINLEFYNQLVNVKKLNNSLIKKVRCKKIAPTENSLQNCGEYNSESKEIVFNPECYKSNSKDKTLYQSRQTFAHEFLHSISSAKVNTESKELSEEQIQEMEKGNCEYIPPIVTPGNEDINNALQNVPNVPTLDITQIPINSTPIANLKKDYSSRSIASLNNSSSPQYKAVEKYATTALDYVNKKLGPVVASLEKKAIAAQKSNQKNSQKSNHQFSASSTTTNGSSGSNINSSDATDNSIESAESNSRGTSTQSSNNKQDLNSSREISKTKNQGSANKSAGKRQPANNAKSSGSTNSTSSSGGKSSSGQTQRGVQSASDSSTKELVTEISKSNPRELQERLLTDQNFANKLKKSGINIRFDNFNFIGDEDKVEFQQINGTLQRVR